MAEVIKLNGDVVAMSKPEWDKLVKEVSEANDAMRRASQLISKLRLRIEAQEAELEAIRTRKPLRQEFIPRVVRDVFETKEDQEPPHAPV